MQSWNINGGVLEFYEDTHTYLFNGKKCASVTQVLHTLFPDKYKDIDLDVLKKAANRGTEIHNAIEMYETLGIERNDLIEFRNYKFLKNYYMFDVIEVEKPIVIIYKGYVFCGRFDMLLTEPKEVDNENQLAYRVCLEDTKTTAILDIEYLEMQLSLYKEGVKQCYPDYKIDGLRAIHLKNEKRRYVVINEVDATAILDKYIEIVEGENNENS